MEYYPQNQEPIVVQMVPVEEEEEEVDDPGAPFVEENPCLVCGHKAFANFIDISYGTSCTSTTETPVKKILREIIGKAWCTQQKNQTLCLACYDLVDRFDSLESQLNSIRENVIVKYQKTIQKTFGKTKNSAASLKKRGKQKNKKQFKKVKCEVMDSDDDDDEVGSGNVFEVEICGDGSELNNVPDHTDQNEQPDEGRAQQQQMQQSQYSINEMPSEELPNPSVYDEDHQLLQQGQKIRLGKHELDENGVNRFACAYCPNLWADLGSLHTHVHSFHQPEIVDVTIPAELGLGNTMNCGVEIQNCQEPPHNPKPWSCLFCDQTFRARTNMSSHFKDKHTPHKPFSCTECGEAFRKGIDLNRHKLYFCAHRTVQFPAKRKYNKKRESRESNQGKMKREDPSVDPDEPSMMVQIPVS